MNYDGLDRAYWESQITRIEGLRAKIAARASSPAGRVIPDDTDLAIGTGRRLNLTVMFIDITRFSTRRSITADEQELMLRVLNLFFTEMIRLVEDYGGAVEKNTGDGLMAYFEDQPGDDRGAISVKRAIACALTMAAANEFLISPILRATDVPPLEFRTQTSRDRPSPGLPVPHCRRSRPNIASTWRAFAGRNTARCAPQYGPARRVSRPRSAFFCSRDVAQQAVSPDAGLAPFGRSVRRR